MYIHTKFKIIIDHRVPTTYLHCMPTVACQPETQIKFICKAVLGKIHLNTNTLTYYVSYSRNCDRLVELKLVKY